VLFKNSTTSEGQVSVTGTKLMAHVEMLILKRIQRREVEVKKNGVIRYG
jgi:hypothetical protein